MYTPTMPLLSLSLSHAWKDLIRHFSLWSDVFWENTYYMGDNNTPGIIQIAVNYIFNQLHQVKQRHLISCSYFDICNEKINGFLAKNEKESSTNTYISKTLILRN